MQMDSVKNWPPNFGRESSEYRLTLVMALSYLKMRDSQFSEYRSWLNRKPQKMQLQMPIELSHMYTVALKLTVDDIFFNFRTPLAADFLILLFFSQMAWYFKISIIRFFLS